MIDENQHRHEGFVSNPDKTSVLLISWSDLIINDCLQQYSTGGGVGVDWGWNGGAIRWLLASQQEVRIGFDSRLLSVRRVYSGRFVLIRFSPPLTVQRHADKAWTELSMSVSDVPRV